MARIVAPTVANLTYSRTVDSVPQLVFLGIAACFFAAGVASVFARPAGFDGALASKESEESEQMVPLQTQKQCHA